MKRPLNLNGPNVVFLKVIGLFVIVLPITFYLCRLLLGLLGMNAELVTPFITVSLIVGAAAVVLFTTLILVEQVRDHLFGRHYQRLRQRKLRLPGGAFECQYCGNRLVREGDSRCPLCGKQFIM